MPQHPATPTSRRARRRLRGRRAGLAASVTAVGAAAALLVGGAAAPASADDGRTFTTMLAQLRGCESGGNYAINTGNGYYGAYQFDLRTWQGLGGTGYPHQNPPTVQDEMATRLYEQRGWSPWPSCSRSLGLYPVPVDRPATGSVPVGHVDVAVGQSGGVHVAGWAVDRDSDPSPIQVHVYVDAAGTPLTAAAPRPDVAAALGVGADHGFDAVLPAAPGPHHVCSFAINTGPAAVNPVLSCVDVVVPQSPVGHLDTARVQGQGTWVTGWAMDPDAPSAPVFADVYVDGRGTRRTTASAPRPDIARTFGPAVGPDHGFRVWVPGGSQVCVFAIDTAGTATNPLLGCLTPSR